MLKAAPKGVPIDDATAAEAIAIIRGGLGKAELENVGAYVTPIFWFLRGAAGKSMMKGGTAFFIDTGSNVFGVTASHVVAECFSDSRCSAFQGCFLGALASAPMQISLGDRLIDGNYEIDIATFRINRVEVANLGRQVLRGKVLTWPPKLPEQDCGLSWAGFPAKGRRWMASQDYVFGLVGMTCFATSVNENCISLQIERNAMVQILGGSPMPDNFDYGGVSGGLVLGIYQEEILQSWFPVGVIFQGPNPSNDPSQQAIEGLEIIRARPLHFLKDNGEIDLERWGQTHF